jgi:AcrR family transcriptional regulator
MDAVAMHEFQRTRIVAAMIAVVCDRGIESASISRIASEAGVSRKTFYEIFTDRDDCLLAAVDVGVACAAERAREASASADSWVDRVRAGLCAILEFLDEEPALAQVCVVQSMRAGPAVTKRRGELLTKLEEHVDQGRLGASREPPPLTVEGVVAGVLGIIQSRLAQPEPVSLVELLGPLTSFIVLPYLGLARARRELARSPPGVSSRSGARALNPLDDLKMRLTYRTMRVIAAIAAQPGLSNSQISERAGVTDQGQISKLLARLALLELIENDREDQDKGAPNSWRLTDRGEAAHRAIRRERLSWQRVGSKRR